MGAQNIIYFVSPNTYLIIDIIFMADIIFHFFTGYNENGIFISKRRPTVMNYLRYI